jgi:peptidoglycan pentaglycine glycine transferase (the first glycine)
MVSDMRICSSADRDFVSPQEWDAFVRSFPGGHVLQSWAWGELKAMFGWRPLRIAAIEGRCILAAAQVLLRPLAFGRLSTAYIPKGPLVEPAGSPEYVSLLSAVHNLCRRRGAISLKLEPDWEEGVETRAFLMAQGLIPSDQTIQPRRTVVIDLAPDEEEILSQMKPKTRYNIRLAGRRGVSVRLGTAGDLPAFYRLLRATGRRAGFGIHSESYYTHAWQLFAAKGSVALVMAEYGAKPLAALMIFVWGTKAWYLYGASSDEERQRMPTHLAQWEAMRWAKARGCETYDLWGIPDVEESDIGPSVMEAEDHGALSGGMGGLYRFKRGFGGREVRYVGAYDSVYNRPLYRLLTTVWAQRSS